MINVKQKISILVIPICVMLLSPCADAFVWNQKHLDYNGCDTCHNLHGSPGFSLLAGVDTESTCVGCHGVAGPGPEASIHDPSGAGIGNLGYIGCRDCHDSMHDEDSFAGGDNIKMIGTDKDFEYSPPNTSFFSTLKASLREELPTSDLASPVYKSVVFKDRNTDFSRGSNDGVCQICHDAGPPAGPTDLNNHQWGDCTVCHMHSEGFAKLQCVDCHDVNFTVATSAPKVVDKSGGSPGAVGSHLRVNGADPIVGLSDVDWTVQCIECHTGHSGDVIVPNNATVGIDYQMTGGIGLGGNATSGTTEAQICWNCHGAGQSEWNALADHGFTVTGGEDWTAVSFDLAGTTVPTRPVLSIHTANDVDYNPLVDGISSSVEYNVNWPAGTLRDGIPVGDGSPTLEIVDQIRCSYCHDVHDLNLATNDATSGQPYLRGSWLHNPYVATEIERPPESSDSWTNNRWEHFDVGDTVPRLRTDVAGANQIGGYQIDQNNNFPTSPYLDTVTPANELTDTAGLCVLCHGSDVDNMDYYSAQNLWIGSNGHANAVLGGTGLGAISLFDARDRDGQLSTAMGFYMAGQGADVPNRDKWGDESAAGDKRNDQLPYGFRGADDVPNAQPDDGNSSGNTATFPLFTGYYSATGIRNTDNMPAEYTAWYSATGIGSNTSISGRAHDFSCSKCHTPHASGLPALLITNCLDYTVSDWSVVASGPMDGSPANVTLGPSATYRWATEVMNNCHRKDDTTTGWNVLAPGQ